MARSVTPHLMFEGAAEEAMNRYLSIFPGASITRIDRYNYGFSTRFGWCNDRFGVAWQLNLQ